ncbi:MAG: hypothetical protein M3377_04740 [Actinomycetota bacterium]|nr:hypothetical protein [Actinomycetota bacterium]
MTSAWMVALEASLAASGEDELATALVVLASVAGERVPLEPERRLAATRRALLLLTAGGDPTRGLDLNGRAVTALAEDLRDTDRQIALEEGIRELAPAASGLPHVSEALHALIHAPDVAWRAYVCSLLAEDLGDE